MGLGVLRKCVEAVGRHTHRTWHGLEWDLLPESLLEKGRGRHSKSLRPQGLVSPHPDLGSATLGSVVLARLGAFMPLEPVENRLPRLLSQAELAYILFWHPGCVTLGTLLTLSGPQCLHLETRFGKPTSQDCWRLWLGRPMSGSAPSVRALT